ncbi:MAG: Transposase family protein [Tardiphaga sp.]|nr:Transposase family protein [Tardiphaga sp.]
MVGVRCRCLWCRWSVVQRGVRSDRVFVIAPLLDNDRGFLQAVEDLTVQAYITQLPIEGRAVAVLPRTAWLDVKCFRRELCKPAAHDPGRHPRTVVGSMCSGTPLVFTASDPLNPIATDLPAGSNQQRCDPAIAIPSVSGCQRDDLSRQRIFINPDDRGVAATPRDRNLSSHEMRSAIGCIEVHAT